MIQQASRISGIEQYFFAKKLAEIKAMEETNGQKVINLGIGSPDLLPDSRIIDQLHTSSLSLHANMYQSYTGIPELRIAFAEWYKKNFGVLLDPSSEILPMIGSKEGIMHLTMSYIEDGDKVLVPNPGYPAYTTCTSIAGGTSIHYELDPHNWLPNLDLISTLDLSQVKLMWVNYPNMPTGSVADIGFYKALLGFAKTHNILVCNDNPYSFILNDDPISILNTEGGMSNFVEFTSLSKNYNMAGWRVGALVANKDIINTVLKFKSNMDSGMYYPIQMAAAKALSLERTIFESQNEVYRKRRQVADLIVKELGCTIEASRAGMFVWARVPAGMTGNGLSEMILHKAGVFITPGFIFGSGGNNYIRISLCSPIETFEDALSCIKAMEI